MRDPSHRWPIVLALTAPMIAAAMFGALYQSNWLTTHRFESWRAVPSTPKIPPAFECLSMILLKSDLHPLGQFGPAEGVTICLWSGKCDDPALQFPANHLSQVMHAAGENWELEVGSDADYATAVVGKPDCVAWEQSWGEPFAKVQEFVEDKSVRHWTGREFKKWMYERAEN